MYDKLDFIQNKYEELSMKVSDPEVISDQKLFQKYAKDISDMEPIVHKYVDYKRIVDGIREAKEILNDGDGDEEMRELAKMELSDLEEQKDVIEGELKILLIPKDPNDEKNVILEIRAGTGGEEAALFGSDLMRMYMRYAERHRWKTEIIDVNDTGMGGIKEAVMMIKGKGAYSRLKYESGVHRVQRVPETESSGRIHTSAATVAVLPEADDVEVDLNPNDVRVDVYRATGHGGQCVNTTDSAVRLTHMPTGLVVTCQDEMMLQQQHNEMAEERKSQVGSGDRSERIRTYNFPQGRISDHRIGLTIYKLDYFLDGDLDEVIDALITTDQAEKMKNF